MLTISRKHVLQEQSNFILRTGLLFSGLSTVYCLLWPGGSMVMLLKLGLLLLFLATVSLYVTKFVAIVGHRASFLLCFSVIAPSDSVLIQFSFFMLQSLHDGFHFWNGRVGFDTSDQYVK